MNNDIMYLLCGGVMGIVVGLFFIYAPLVPIFLGMCAIFMAYKMIEEDCDDE